MKKTNQPPKHKQIKSSCQLAVALAAGAILAAGSSLRAADVDSSTTTTTQPALPAPNNYEQGRTNNVDSYYHCNELSLDGFGMGSVGSYTLEHPSEQRVRQNSKGGAGAGINYFITRYVGVGGEVYSQNTTGTFIDNADGNLLLRLPLGPSGFAPYAFGGGGQQFDAAKLTFGQAGAGMEYRFCHHIGVFVDARCVWPNETKYYGVGRAGLRFAF
jgi:hypothetical protein